MSRAWHRLRTALAVVGAPALLVSACGGDDVANRCAERFNSPANQMRQYVATTGEGAFNGQRGDDDFRAPVWFGESKVRPEKCVGVIGLGGEGAFIVVRENFNPGAKPGTWTGLSGVSEGSEAELGGRVRTPVALGNDDGTVEVK